MSIVQKDYEELDRLDEEQILQELKGRTIDKLFYEIKGQGPALSWAGVKYFAIQLGHMEIESCEVKENEEFYQATAWARDKSRDLRVMGAAEQLKISPYDKKRDAFALAKVVSKAQRNAFRNLIPETMISEAFKLWKTGEREERKATTSEAMARRAVGEPISKGQNGKLSPSPPLEQTKTTLDQ